MKIAAVHTAVVEGNYDWTYVRIDTDDESLRGLGECYTAPGPTAIVYNAISGMEAALWDLVGRAYGVPVYRLLGGRYRDSVRIYADCHAGEALESMDATMVARPARWAQDPPEALATGAVRAPEHGRAYARAAPDEVFTPDLYAARAREV